MTQKHPITPPDELVRQWTTTNGTAYKDIFALCQSVADQAARWARAELAEPADGEVAELVLWLLEDADDYDCIGETLASSKCRRAASLLESLSLPQPVPVSERLPGPSDCAPWPKDSDASAWCWVGTDKDGGWDWEQRSAGCLVMFPGDFTHWLPAHALPVPSHD